MKNVKILAAKTIIAFAFMLANPVTSNAGIPVIDGANLGENIATLVEEATQTVKQGMQYATQLNEYSTQIRQYQTELQNTLAPATYLWDQAQQTTGSLLGSINTLNSYKQQFGNLPTYLNQFKNISQYRGNNSCFAAGGCNGADYASIANSNQMASTAQQDANNASILGLDQQQSALSNDASTLTNLQSSAQSATGQMQAIGYGNQIAAEQSNQLLQIRGLLIAEQNVVTTRNQAIADREAQQAAAATQIRTGNFVASPQVAW